MDVADLALPRAWQVAGGLAALPILAVALRRGDWSRAGENEPVHAFLAGLAALAGLWLVRGDVEGIAFHLLGIAGLALAAGPARALAVGAVVVALVTLVRGADVGNAAWVWLTLVALPVAVVAGVLRVAERRLPENLFVYVFVVAFAGAALSMAAAGAAGAALGVVAGVRAEVPSLAGYAPFLLVLAFAEATLTGMLVTLGVVYRPQWMTTFDDARYLGRRG